MAGSASVDNDPDQAATIREPQRWTADQTGPDDHDRPTPAESPPGFKVARYVVLAEIGRGTMGRVLRAYDPKLEREVALKAVRTDALDAQGHPRLAVEAQAMAKLSHPHVVAVYDVESLDGGEVIVVMEYVAGTTLQEWLQQHTGGWAEVVKTFIAAGRGLAAAHQVGLLHRDFKPTNVLLGTDGCVKVTDFGLAKFGEHRPRTSPPIATDDATAPAHCVDGLTQAGFVMGTPRYMAPEQHGGEPLTAAADQYGFCVALWEALCGEAPFVGEGLKDSKRAGPPAWPNPEVPRTIANAIRRGLAPGPQDRWPSMGALLAALAPRPPRPRHRWLLGAACLGVVGFGWSSWDAWASSYDQRCSGAAQELAGIWGPSRQAEVEAAMGATAVPYAGAASGRTSTELSRYADAWTTMHRATCEATTVHRTQSAEVMDLRMACLRRAKAGLAGVTKMLVEADAEVVRRAHEIVGGLDPLARCADVEALQAEVEPPRPEDAAAVDAVRSLLTAASAAQAGGRYKAAQNLVAAASAQMVPLEYPPVRAEVTLAQAAVLEKLGDYEASESALRQALQLASSSRQSELLQAAATLLITVVGDRQGRYDEGLQYRHLAEGLAVGAPLREARALHAIASVLEARGDLAEAEAGHRRALALRQAALGPDHPDVANSRNNLATVIDAQGRYDEAEAEHRHALALWEKLLGPDHPDVASSRSNLAVVLAAQDKFDDAMVELRRSLAISERALGPEHPDVVCTHQNLGAVLLDQGKYEQAETEHRMVLAMRLRTLGPEHPSIASAHNNLGSALYGQGRYVEAEQEHRRAIALRKATLGPDHPALVSARYNLGLTLEQLEKYAEAEREYRLAVAVHEQRFGAEDSIAATIRAALGDVLVAQRKPEAAELEYRQALRAFERSLGPDHRDAVDLRDKLAALVSGRAEP